MAKFGFLAEFTTHPDRVVVFINSLPGCVSDGKDQREAEKKIRDAMEGYIASKILGSEEVFSDPKPPPGPDYRITAGCAGVSKYMEIEFDTTDTERLAKLVKKL